jgi:hypothetical protein
MHTAKERAQNEPAVFKENPWVIGLYVSGFIVYGLSFWGPYADVGIFAFMGHWRSFWGVVFLLSLAYGTIEAFTRTVTISDAWIIVKSLGKNQQMQTDDVAYWKPWRRGLPYGFLIWSKQGKILRIQPFIDRPKELEGVLRTIATEKPD